MGGYKVTREKLIRHKGVSVESDVDGNVNVQIDPSTDGAEYKQIVLTDAEAANLYRVMGNIVGWDDDE